MTLATAGEYIDMDSFYIVYNPDKTGEEYMADFRSYMSRERLRCEVMDCYSFSSLTREEVTRALEGYECMLVFGGDGTLLNTATAVSHVDILLFGVNMGTVGFLTEGEMTGQAEFMDRLRRQDFKIQERMMLRGTLQRGGDMVFRKRALNDIVITRAGFSRLIGLDVYVNGSLLNAYEGDGIIISTPTGSTGYNLSAGGPIAYPTAELTMITPICPHSLTSKSIVLPRDAQIRVAITKKRKTQDTEAIVSFDGGNDYELTVGDVIEVEASHRTTKLIKVGDMNFYEILRQKLSV